MLTQFSGSARPLTRHVKLDTTAPDEARDVVGRIFCPHFLSPVERRAQGFHARHHSARQTGYSVNYVAYGATVEIDPGELSGFFLLQIPLAGSARVRCGRAEAEVAPGRMASLLSPTLSTRMVWAEGCEKLIVLLDRGAVETQMRALSLNGDPTVEFSTGVALDGFTGSQILGHASLMLSAAESLVAVPEAYQVTLRDSLTALLLTGLEHSRLKDIGDRPREAAPAAVRRAEDFIAAHACRPIAMADIAEASGVGLRALQEAVKRSSGLTLTEMVLKRRLEIFRAALLDPSEPRSVSDLALAAGLGHLGRAAAAYRARFGESPSETLRRR